MRGLDDLPDDLPELPPGLWVSAEGAPRCAQPTRPLKQFKPDRRELFNESQSIQDQ